jgi:hypothetical protein
MLSNAKKAKRQTLPPQDQPPFAETILSDGNILRAYQCTSGSISNICAQLVDGTTGVNIGDPVVITNSTTSRIFINYLVWPQVTPHEIFFLNTTATAISSSGDNRVHRCPITIANNTIIPGTTAVVPLFDGNSWMTSVQPVTPHYSVDFQLSTNKSYFCVRAPSNNVPRGKTPVLAGVSFDVEGNAASNGYYNNDTADYPIASGVGLGYVNGGNLGFYPDVLTQTINLKVNTGKLGSGTNKLRIGTLSDGSRLFTWQAKNGTALNVFKRHLSVTNTWLDTSDVLVSTLAAVNGEPQPQVIVNPNGGYYIVAREVCPSNNTVGICVRGYQNDDTLLNPVVLVIDDAQAQFPTGTFTNGKLFVSACELDGAGNCAAIVNNANALSQTSVPTITPTNSLTITLTKIFSNTTQTISTTSSINGPVSSTALLLTTLMSTNPTSSGFTALSGGTSTTNSITSGMINQTSSAASTNQMSQTPIPEMNFSVSSGFTSPVISSGPNQVTSADNNTAAIAGGAAAGLGALLLVGIIGAWAWMRGKQKGKSQKEVGSIELGTAVSHQRTSQYGNASLHTKGNTAHHQPLPVNDERSSSGQYGNSQYAVSVRPDLSVDVRPNYGEVDKTKKTEKEYDHAPTLTI